MRFLIKCLLFMNRENMGQMNIGGGEGKGTTAKSCHTRARRTNVQRAGVSLRGQGRVQKLQVAGG